MKALLILGLTVVGLIVVGILAAIAIPVFLNKTHATSRNNYADTIAYQTKSGMNSLPPAAQTRVCALFQQNPGPVATKIATTDLDLAATNSPTAYANMLKTTSHAQLLQITTYGVTQGLNEFCAGH